MFVNLISAVVITVPLNRLGLLKCVQYDGVLLKVRNGISKYNNFLSYNVFACLKGKTNRLL